MKLPNIEFGKFVDKEGSLLENWRIVLTELFDTLQNNLSDEGFVIPTQTTTNIGIIAAGETKPAIWYDSDTNQPKININGAVKVIQTAAGDSVVLNWTAPLQFSSNTASITKATVSTDGYLSSVDWDTFNNKQNALTNPVTGTGASGQYAEFNGTTTITGAGKNTAFNANFETATANIKPNGTVSVGALSTLPRADHVHALSATAPVTYNNTNGVIGFSSRSILCGAETASNYNNRRSRAVGGTGTFRFNFFIPEDFNSLISAEIIFYVSSGAAGTSKNIDITTEYTNSAGQLYNQFTASDTTTVYNLTGYTDKQYRLPITSLLSNIVAGTEGGVKLDNNAIGGTLDVIGILIKYN